METKQLSATSKEIVCEEFPDHIGDQGVIDFVDVDNSSLVGAIIFWKSLNNHIVYCSGESTRNFQQEIPLEEFHNSCATAWLHEIRTASFNICSFKDDEKSVLSSGFQMSPSFIRSSSDVNSTNAGLDNVEVFCNNGDLHLATDFVRKRIEERNYLKVSKVFHQSITEDALDFLLDAQFESSILKIQLPSTSVNQTEFIIPSLNDHQVETPVILIGYPHRPSKAYLRNTYENPPEKKEFNAFFTYNLKTASIGKIKSINTNVLLVSCATCCGMSGSPVFSLNGDLIGFLLGSKKCFTYNNVIVLSVNHPTFVIEYLSYAGYELLVTEKEKYLPLLTPYISKHYDLIMKEINSNVLKESMKENLRRVLDVFNSQ